jgi:intracellular septation protein A
MQETVKPLDPNRLSVLMAVLLLGSAIFRFIELPEQVWELEPLGSPLEIHVTGTWLLAALMVGLVCTGTNLILHDHPHLEEYPGRPIYVSWILPGLMAGLSAYLLASIPTWPLWIAGLVLVGVGISMTISAEYTAVSPGARGYPRARLALNVLAYLLTFALFTIIYHSRTRSLVTATVTLLAATLLALDLLSVADVRFRRVLLFAGIVGLVTGESTWALNYWQVSAWAGGLFLLLIFYIVVNVAHQYLLERLSATVLVEFAVVAVIVLTIILLRAP